MRPRANVSATVPGTGRVNATANVIVTWDEDAPLADIEEAVKQAARDAVRRVRVVRGIDYAEGGYVGGPRQLTLPGL